VSDWRWASYPSILAGRELETGWEKESETETETGRESNWGSETAEGTGKERERES
jgi:hypothetical protein